MVYVTSKEDNDLLIKEGKSKMVTTKEIFLDLINKTSFTQRWYSEEEIRKILDNLWNHPKRFEGIKGKTCLPLDYIEQEFDCELFEE